MSDRELPGLLMAAANTIVEHANALEDCHTIGGKWPESEASAKAAWLREIALAGRLIGKATELRAAMSTTDKEKQG